MPHTQNGLLPGVRRDRDEAKATAGYSLAVVRRHGDGGSCRAATDASAGRFPGQRDHRQPARHRRLHAYRVSANRQSAAGGSGRRVCCQDGWQDSSGERAWLGLLSCARLSEQRRQRGGARGTDFGGCQRCEAHRRLGLVGGANCIASGAGFCGQGVLRGRNSFRSFSCRQDHQHHQRGRGARQRRRGIGNPRLGPANAESAQAERARAAGAGCA